LNLLIFLASIIISIIGVISDNLTTRKFIGDIGIEFESNVNYIKICEKWGYKTWVVIEAIIVAAFGVGDFISNVLFLGIFYGLCRGLIAANNFQIISEYRAIGIAAFRKKSEMQRTLLQNVSQVNRYKMRLHYFVCFFICVILFSLISSIGTFQGVGLFLLSTVEGLIFGMGSFFLTAGLSN
jgi:hypothetical protein